jgi:hypothetical protein
VILKVTNTAFICSAYGDTHTADELNEFDGSVLCAKCSSDVTVRTQWDVFGSPALPGGAV